jgi:diguanylate cyclase (GGDEF)-like protein
LAGQDCGTLLAPDHASMLVAALKLGVGQPFEARAQHADGSTPWVEITVAQAPYAPATAVLTLRDINARKQAELQLQQASRELEAMAHTDALTGAANRRSFDIGLGAEWRRTRREGRPLALLLFDVDYFKRLNDSHGHPAGDEVLKRLAVQLRNHARRPGDLSARYGGEEFALILPSTGAEAALRIGDSVRRAFRECFADRPELATTVSAGVAVAPEDAASPAELLLHADAALYRAKAQGRDRCVLWRRDAARG